MTDTDELLTVLDISKLLKCNRNFASDLLKAGLIPYLQLGSRKVRRKAFNEFLAKYEGWDITDPYHPKEITESNERAIS